MAPSKWPLSILLTLLSCSNSVFAQGGDPDIRILNATNPTYTLGEVTVHLVTVGNNSHAFSPNSITATPGDIISFSFWPGGHSVIHSEFGYPCVPFEDVHDGQGGFFSGTMNATSTYNPVWNLTVNDTSPIFFYCGAPGSCVGHAMLGAINPIAETPVLTQMALAKEADYQRLPGQDLPQEAFLSLSSLAQSATTVTVTAGQTSMPVSTTSAAAASTSTTAATAPVPSHSGLTTGAIAGIAVGGVIILALAAGLFYFFGRSKTLKEQVRASQQREDGRAAQSRHASGLPPYAPAWMNGAGDGGYKTTSEVGTTVIATPATRVGSLEMRQQEFATSHGHQQGLYR
jgi:plastocyanin